MWLMSDIEGVIFVTLVDLCWRVAQRLPHLTAHDVAALDREVREALTEVGTG